VPVGWTEADERRMVGEVAALLPPRIKLEFDGRYAAMLSHEPKNYALQSYGGALVLRGVAFRSSRAEPFGEAFLRRALIPLLAGDLVGVHDAYLATVSALRKRELPTRDVTARVRLTKLPEQYLATRDARRELPYEAVLASGRTAWTVGERVRVYRGTRGRSCLFVESADADDAPDAPGVAGSATAGDPRDYDVEHYVRVLRDTYAARLVRAVTAEDFATIFADPDQPSLFARSLRDARPILTPIESAGPASDPAASDDEDDVHDTRHAIHR
jgi:DNA polymerase elongation subunit (family B)